MENVPIKIESFGSEYSEQGLKEKLSKIARKAGIDIADAHYLTSINTIEKDMYNIDDDHIAILYKDGTIKDIAEASEILNVSLLSKKIRKYYLCYHRF